MNSNLSQNRYRPIVGHLINSDGLVGIYVGYRPKHSNLVYIVKGKNKIRNCSCKTLPKHEIEIIAIAKKILEMPKSGWSCLDYYPILTKNNIVNLSRENMSDRDNLRFIPYSREEWEKDHATEKNKSQELIDVW